MTNNISRPKDSPIKNSSTQTKTMNVVTSSIDQRIAGEIAFQLDNRIISYIFIDIGVDKKRYYGYTVQNITDMIERETVNLDTGKI